MDLGHAVQYLISKIRTGGPPLPPGIKLGKGVQINRKAALDWRYGKHLTIGDGVRIAYGAVILCHDSTGRGRTGLIRVAPVTIGDRATILANAVILPGIKIGKDAIVGAGAVVTKDVADGDIVGGVPARSIGRADDFDRRELEDVKKKKCFDAAVIYSDDKKVRAAIEKEQMEAIERDGGYYVLDPAKGSKGE